MPYLDFFLAAVATDKRETYADFCARTHGWLIELGALEVADYWGTDVPEGKLTSLPMAVKAEPGETVVAGWVTWPSKEARDTAWAKMTDDDPLSDMPFDGKRMIFGGFEEVLVTRA